MVNFWRFHWLWCCCVLHSNLLVAGDEETVPLYKKMLSDTRESVKFSDPKYSHILRGTESDLRRTGSDIVKKSNDHLEKQTAPNRVNRVLPAPASASESNRSVADQVGLFQNGSDNATRNARDLSYDAVAVAATDATIAALVSSKNHSSDLAYSLDTTENKKTTTFSNDTVLDESAPSTPISAPTPTAAPTPTSASTSNATTVSTLILKNPKDKQNKTKLDFNPSFAKKAAVNVKAKNASSSSAENVQKPEISVSLNDSRYDNSSQSVVSGDQWNYNVTVNVQNTNSKNISLLTAALGEGEANETKMAATSRRTMQESQPFNTLNLALITITTFAVLCIIVVLSMMFVMLYRRYHWNKPQTLSDKCSNADSTGYIDDSTLKENSEEMYSLDNDSFLNSLEAMTIQNYWADSIRHTKL